MQSLFSTGFTRRFFDKTSIGLLNSLGDAEEGFKGIRFRLYSIPDLPYKETYDRRNRAKFHDQ